MINMPYESFTNNHQCHLTIDNVVSCFVITLYIGCMGWFIYQYVKEYT
jgi:hypothetical protein